MYAKVNLLTAFGGRGYQGGAMDITLVNDASATDVVMKEITIFTCKANTSVVSLELITSALKAIPKRKTDKGEAVSAISRIEFYVLDTVKEGSPYITSVMYGHNKWAKAGYLNADGEPLKNGLLVEAFRTELFKHKVELTDGTFQELDIFMYTKENYENQDLAKKTVLRLKKTALKCAQEVRKKAIKNINGKFDFNDVKVQIEKRA